MGLRTPVEEQALNPVMAPVHLRTGAIHPNTRKGERALGTGRRVEYGVRSHRPVHVPTVGVEVELVTQRYIP